MKRYLLLLLALCVAVNGLAQPRLTVKEFLRLSPADTTSYAVTGVVEKVRSSTSGSFYLKDANAIVTSEEPIAPAGYQFVGWAKTPDAAEAAGADYVGVGAVFGTSTKKDARCMTVERLREIAESVSIPVVAIGGINAENIPLLAGSGIDGVAVISALFGAPDPAAATEELLSRVREIVQA